MYKVIYNKKINDNSYEILINAPLITKNALPGQFVTVMAHDDSEKIPISIYDMDKEKGNVYLIYQVIGGSTLELSYVKDSLFSISGPLGKPGLVCNDLERIKNKKIIYIGGGIGIAPVYNQVKYLHDLGIKVDVIYGARNEEAMIIRDNIESVSNKVMYATDDGSYGIKGFVTTILEDVIDDYDLCVAIGPVIMMKSVCELTKKHNVETIVSMNPIMIDGTGMCGACRCKVDGKMKFACIDGPEFDGHKVDFDLALKRMNIYKEEEKEKLALMKERLDNNG